MKAGLRRSGGEQKRRQDETKSVRANAINAVENATQARSRDLAVEVRRESVVDIVRARHVTVVGARDPVLGLAAEARGGQTGEVETIATDVIDAIERVRLSQGKNEKRVRLMVITLSPDALPSLEEIRLSMPKTIVLGVNETEKEQLLRQFIPGGGGSAAPSGSVFLIDPMGNLMMSYPATADPTDLRKDISRLLRASRIG